MRDILRLGLLTVEARWAAVTETLSMMRAASLVHSSTLQLMKLVRETDSLCETAVAMC